MTDKFVKINREFVGNTPNMCWVERVRDGRQGLFKPDTERKESYREVLACKVCRYLGIPSADVVYATFNGSKGCVSFDCLLDSRHMVVDAGDLYKVPYYNYSTEKWGKIGEISFEGLRDFVPKRVQEQLIDMLFLDWLLVNMDRHEYNFAFYVTKKSVIVDLVPLYDNGACLGSRDVALFPYKGVQEYSHLDNLLLAYKDWKEQIDRKIAMVCKAEFKNIIGENDVYQFIMKRVDRFKNIVYVDLLFNDRQKRILFNRRILYTVREYADIFSVSESTARDDLNDLVNKGYAEKTLSRDRKLQYTIKIFKK